MAQGIQVFNANGTLQFDTSNRLMRTLTEVVSGTSDGSVVVSGSEQGTIAAVAVETDSNKMPPTIASTGNGVSWSFNTVPPAERGSARITIMVF